MSVRHYGQRKNALILKTQGVNSTDHKRHISTKKSGRLVRYHYVLINGKVVRVEDDVSENKIITSDDERFLLLNLQEGQLTAFSDGKLWLAALQMVGKYALPGNGVGIINEATKIKTPSTMQLRTGPANKPERYREASFTSGVVPKKQKKRRPASGLKGAG